MPEERNLSEYNKEWLEIKRYLSIRSSNNPVASKEEKYIIYLCDATGISIPWINRGEINDVLLPYDHRVNAIALSKKNILAFGSDINGNERWQIKTYDIENGILKHIMGDNNEWIGPILQVKGHNICVPVGDFRMIATKSTAWRRHGP